MEMIKSKLERLLWLAERATPGPWRTEPGYEGAEVYSSWEKRCDCESKNKDCLLDCICDETVHTKRKIFDAPTYKDAGNQKIGQEFIDSDFVALCRELVPELVKFALLSVESDLS